MVLIAKLLVTLFADVMIIHIETTQELMKTN